MRYPMAGAGRGPGAVLSMLVLLSGISLTGTAKGDSAQAAGIADSKPALQQCARATIKAFRLFTVGEAVLFRSDCRVLWPDGKAQPMVLEFRYERTIPSTAFREAAERYLTANGVRISATIDQFHHAYREVKAGDVYRLVWTDVDGLSLRLNGQHLARLPPDEGWRYFSIWLGEVPFSERLKAALLHSP